MIHKYKIKTKTFLTFSHCQLSEIHKYHDNYTNAQQSKNIKILTSARSKASSFPSSAFSRIFSISTIIPRLHQTLSKFTSIAQAGSNPVNSHFVIPPSPKPCPPPINPVALDQSFFQGAAYVWRQESRTLIAASASSCDNLAKTKTRLNTLSLWQGRVTQPLLPAKFSSF